MNFALELATLMAVPKAHLAIAMTNNCQAYHEAALKIEHVEQQLYYRFFDAFVLRPDLRTARVAYVPPAESYTLDCTMEYE